MLRSRLWLYGTSVLALAAVACSAPRIASTGPHADAAPDAAEAGETGAHPPSDAGEEAAHGGDAEADVQASSCPGPPDGGALSAPEAMVTGASGLDGLALTSEGVVWLANADSAQRPQVWLATDPPSLLLDAEWSPLVVGPVLGFAAATHWCALSSQGYLEPSATVALDTLSGKTLSLGQGNFAFDLIEMDDSRSYALASRFGQGDVACFSIVPGACGSLHQAKATAIAADGSRLYALVLGADYYSDGAYAVKAKTKGSDTPLSVIGSGHVLAPGSPPPGSSNEYFYMAAANGNVAWAHLPPYPALPHRIYGIVNGGSPRVLADDPEGVAVLPVGIDAPGGRQMIALDAQYVYWATGTGKIKRRRLCGGPVEVLATDQEYPIALTVDDAAIYWISRGSDLAHPVGNIMRIRKLDAPDAGADATSDVSLDGAADASPDAGPD